MLSRNHNKPLPEKTTYYFDEKKDIIVKIVSNTPTRYPEQLAKLNELLKKAKFMTPAQRQEAARKQADYVKQLNDLKKE